MDAVETTALMVQVKSEIIASNVTEYCERIREGVAGINRDLKTDDEFGQAKLDVKILQDVTKSLTDGKAFILSQMQGVNDMLASIDSTSDFAKASIAELTKLIKTREAEIKDEIIEEALTELPYPAEALDRTAVVNNMKCKRTVNTLRSAAEEAVRHLSARYQLNSAEINAAKTQHGPSIAFGESQLLRMTPADLKIEIKRRVERQQAEADRKRLEDVAEKARAEAEKAKAEVASKSEPATLPEPPKIGSIPVGRAVVSQPPKNHCNNRGEVDEATEKQEFMGLVASAFAPIKEARANLKHAANIDAAEVFAQDIAAAWNKFKTA